MADFEEARREVGKMLPHLHSRDETTEGRLLQLTRWLPLASLVAVRESLHRRGVVGVGYAVNALKRQREERDD